MAAPDIEELDKRVLRVQTDGTVSVPMIGAIKAAGLSPIEFQNKLTEALKTQFRDPQVAFTSIDVHSKPVSVLGAVNKPGIQQADGRKTLLEMLSLAGGLEKDAGPVVRVARATTDASTFPSSVRPALSGDHVTAEVSVATLFDGTNPEGNFIVQPGDVITVPKGKLVYVMGDVKKSGGFIIGETDNLTVLKALSLAEGLGPYADMSHTRILRATGNGPRIEQQFDVKKLLAGKTEDVRLQADDILFVPSSTAKKVTARTAEAAVQAAVGIAVWGRR